MHGTENEGPHDAINAAAQDVHEALDDAGEHAAAHPALGLDEEERLPWLESADDDDDEGAIDSGRLVRLALIGVGLLVAIVGALWFFSHRGPADDQVAGGVIAAPSEPYKEAPKDAGGKTFAGTGDSAFAVSEGKNAAPKLGGADTPVPAASTGAAGGAGAAAADAGGVGVQVGAYSTQAAAEAGWSRLSSAHESLKALRHRVLQGTADIGTVYRLQAVAPDLAAANALCAGLKGQGVACQVKH